MQGTGRPTMEDTYNVVIDAKGSDPSFFGVFDGHGGIAVAEYVVLVFQHSNLVVESLSDK